MLLLIALSVFGYLNAAPVKLWNAVTRPTIPNPTCTNDLCKFLDGQGNSQNREDRNYLYRSFEPQWQDRCFYTCAGGVASCQCCNDDSIGKLFYNEKCDRCVYEADKNLEDCPTTKPYSLPNGPCNSQANPNYPNEFCRNLGSILGSNYTNLAGDFPYKVVAETDYAQGALTADEFLNLGGIRNAYISCVAGMVGYCRPCASWEKLEWKVEKNEDGTPKLECGKCDYPQG